MEPVGPLWNLLGDAQFEVNHLTSRILSPREADMLALKRLARYLKGTRDLGAKMIKPTTPSEVVELEVWTDSDWAGDTEERQSQTSVHIMADGCPLMGISCHQEVQSLSSCEAEWHAGARGLSEGLGLKALFTFMGYAVRLKWRCDSSSARALARRQGTGRIKHLATMTLWIQQLVAKKVVEIEPTKGEDNYADLGTKQLPRGRFEWLRGCCGLTAMPTRATASVASISGAAKAGDQANMVTLVKFLATVMALLPCTTKAEPTDLCVTTGDLRTTRSTRRPSRGGGDRSSRASSRGR